LEALSSGPQRPAVRPKEASRLDDRAAESERQGPVWRLEQARRRAPGPHQERASVIRPEARQGGRVAGCLGPLLPLALEWRLGQAVSGEPLAPQVSARAQALRSEPARLVLEAPLPEVAAEVESVSPAVEELGSASVRRAPAVLPGAVGSGSAHAAAVPRPEAVRAASGPQAAVAPEEVPDASQGAEAVASDVTAREPEEVVSARVAAGAVPPRAAARLGARERRAVVPRAAVGPQVWLRAAAPSVALWMVASAFRQDPLRPAAGPARSRWVRLGMRLAHAMRSLQMASRSEPSWQAARSEVESCRGIPGKVLEISVAINRYALGRNVAGEAVASRFISACKSLQNIDVHCAFRRMLQSPHM
jgi:hypothetical protein